MNEQQKPVTIHDIARELGISGSTVSRALKNHPRISQSTRDAVHELAASYGYQPNRLATTLRTGKGNTVGVIVPNINRSFFSNIISGIEAVLSAHGHNLMICQSYENIDKEINALHTLMDARVEGILMSLSMETRQYDHLQEAMEKGVPIIFFDRIPDSIEVNSVSIDDFQAAYQITRNIIENGYASLSFIGGSSHISVYSDRKKGFFRALTDCGIKAAKDWIVETDMTKEGGRKAFEGFIQKGRIPDAVVCAGDFAALGVIQAAKKFQIIIPEQLAVSGFANEDFTSLIDPPLTTVDQRGTEIGNKVAQSYLQYQETGERQHIQITPEVLLRASTHKLFHNSLHKQSCSREDTLNKNQIQ